MEVDYGNRSKLMHYYTERDLYQWFCTMGLRIKFMQTELERIECFIMQNPIILILLVKMIGMLDLGDNHEYFGVGSVLRIIPDVDICTGGELTLVGGMRLTNETIRFTVNYRPLDIFNENIKYSLYAAFKYNEIVTITQGYCDITIIRIYSYNQLAQAEITPVYRTNRIYGNDLWIR